jgi:hypothetical protein
VSFKAWVSDLASTPYKAFISVWLAVFVTVVFTICIALKQELQVEAMYGVFIFVGGMIGADVTQFSIKRKTEIVTPPQTTAENATATTVATAPQPPVKPASSGLSVPPIAASHSYDPDA